MNTVQRIAKNTGVLLIAQIASYILGFFFIMYQTLGKFNHQTFKKGLIQNTAYASRKEKLYQKCVDVRGVFDGEEAERWEFCYRRV